MTEPTITQADRERAASLAVLQEMRELILAGRADHHAEPFARWREADLAEGVAIMREANRATFHRIKEAADAILAPLCAEVGRWLIEGKDEPDMVKVMHDYGVVIPVRAFADLYDATDDTILAAIIAQHKRTKAMDELIAGDADLI